MKFHKYVAIASKNPLYVRTSEKIEAMYTTWLIGFQRSHGVEKSRDYHVQILDAIIRHEPQRASLAMQHHLEDVLAKVAEDVKQKKKTGRVS